MTYAIFAKAKKIDFDEILYLSFELLKRYKHIPYILQYEFPYILIDEYQDTNPIQNAILRLFADNVNVSWGVIGDVAQSIYRFQGAAYEEFEAFSPKSKKSSICAIEDNRRSTINIIHMLNYFRQNDKTIQTQKCVMNTNSNATVKLINMSMGKDVLKIIPDNCVVLSRKWADAFQYIRGLSQEQQKLINDIHNFYTYRMQRDFNKEMEEGKADWIKISKFIVNIKNAISKKCMAKMLEFGKQFIDINMIIQPSKEQALQYKKLNKFFSHFSEITGNMKIEAILPKINKWLDESKLLKIDEIKLLQPGDEYYDKNLYDKVAQLEYNTIKKMVDDVFCKEAKFTTIHRSKGLEFDKVMVSFSPTQNERKKMTLSKTNLTDLLCNPNIYDKNLDDDLSEYLRIIYVGLSRAKDELYVCIDEEVDINKLLVSLQDYAKINDIKKPFFEII